MARSLYNTTNSVRKVLIVFLVIALIYMIISTVGNVQKVGNPGITQFSFYEIADNAIGKIERPVIPAIKIQATSTPTYSVDAPFGSFPDTAFVYQVDEPKEKLTTVTQAQNTAQALGFVPTGFVSNGDNYTWTDSNGSRILHFNKKSQVWNMTTDYSNNIQAKASKQIAKDSNQYQTTLTSLLNQLGFSTGYGLTTPSITSTFSTLSPDGSLTVSQNNIDTQYVIGNIFRQVDLTTLKISSEIPTNLSSTVIAPQAPLPVNVYTSKPIIGEFRSVLSNLSGDNSQYIFEMSFTNFDYSQISGAPVRGLYQIITPDEAWTNVQLGKGALTYLIPENGNPLKVYPNLGVQSFLSNEAKTELAYYEPEVWTGHIYPIYIFRGVATLTDGRLANFVIYTDALKRFS